MSNKTRAVAAGFGGIAGAFVLAGVLITNGHEVAGVAVVVVNLVIGALLAREVVRKRRG